MAAEPRDAVIKSEMERLELAFPVWLFDPTSVAHPRKLDSIPPVSRPARLTGWFPWYWEYGMNLEKCDMDYRMTQKRKGKLRSVEDIIKRIQFDESLNEHDYAAVVEGGGIFSVANILKKSIPTHRIESIRRNWDDVTVWHRGACFDAIFDWEKEEAYCEGLATLVVNLDELFKVTGVPGDHISNGPHKAHFEFTDDEGGWKKGIIYNGRYRGLSRGIITSATKEYNDQYLRGSDRESELGTIGRDA
jgi:hypothetical protein